MAKHIGLACTKQFYSDAFFTAYMQGDIANHGRRPDQRSGCNLALDAQLQQIYSMKPFADQNDAGRLRAICMPSAVAHQCFDPTETVQVGTLAQTPPEPAQIGTVTEECSTGPFLVRHTHYNAFCKGNPRQQGAEAVQTPRALPPQKPEPPVIKDDALSSFTLRLRYPGMLVGIGYTHATEVEADFSNGCSFDYLTGLPLLPGSSLKGVLKSNMQAFEADTVEMINSIKGTTDYTSEDLKADILEIFEGVQEDGNPMPPTKWDVFYDAMPDVANKEKPLMGEDFITPHKDALSDPTPIKLLKINSGIVWRFSFRLQDGNRLRAGEKLELFKQLLLAYGVGAKTNTGYGQFRE